MQRPKQNQRTFLHSNDGARGQYSGGITQQPNPHLPNHGQTNPHAAHNGQAIPNTASHGQTNPYVANHGQASPHSANHVKASSHPTSHVQTNPHSTGHGQTSHGNVQNGPTQSTLEPSVSALVNNSPQDGRLRLFCVDSFMADSNRKLLCYFKHIYVSTVIWI